jgi:hypothetical protein
LANSGDQLILADGTYTGSGYAVLEIRTSITIRALNMGRAVLDGQDSRRVVLISTGIVGLQGLDITMGNWAKGGGIFITGPGTQVEFHSCNIYENTAIYDISVMGLQGLHRPLGHEGLARPSRLGFGGAGIYISGSSKQVDFHDCNIYQNGARTGDGGGAYIRGGAVNFNTCNIYSNYAVAGGGGVRVAGGSVIFNTCNIYSNHAHGSRDAIPGAAPGQGGGVDIWGDDFDI